MAPRAARPDEPKAKKNIQVSRIFSSSRMIFYFVLWTLYFCIDVAMLGLVSQQVHKYGGQNRFNYPTQEYGHAMGLLLFSAVFGLIISLAHWFFSLNLYLPLFLALAVFNGTGAGIFEATPFGHGLQCRHSDDPSRFPVNYQPYLGECSRVTAIEGLAWALFALATFGFFFTILDKFEFRSRRNQVYDLEVPPVAEDKLAAGH